MEDGSGNTAMGAPALNDAIWLYGGDYDTIVYTVTNSRYGVMPPMGGADLSEAEIRAVARPMSTSSAVASEADRGRAAARGTGRTPSARRRAGTGRHGSSASDGAEHHDHRQRVDQDAAADQEIVEAADDRRLGEVARLMPEDRATCS